jgi:hypothetical protein
MPTATIKVLGLKVVVPLSAELLPRDLVPAEGPPGEPTLEVELEGTALVARARINGRNYRKVLKQIDDQGAANVAVVLQGTLKPPASPDGPLVLDGAGFQVTLKTPKPPGEPPAG